VQANMITTLKASHVQTIAFFRSDSDEEKKIVNKLCISSISSVFPLVFACDPVIQVSLSFLDFLNQSADHRAKIYR
jgi:hypothetical protein